MSARYSGMKKIPDIPAAKLLAEANMRLDSKVKAPASAQPAIVLAELDALEAPIDAMKLLAVSLPIRERTWWACLAARDLTGPGAEAATPSLKAAEAWVFDPSDAHREAAATALQADDPTDKTAPCAEIVLYSDGTMGPGEMAQYPAPPGASAIMTFSMVVSAYGEHEGDPDAYAALLIDRAVDIARGGNGRIEAERGAEEEA